MLMSMIRISIGKPIEHFTTEHENTKKGNVTKFWNFFLLSLTVVG